MATKTEFVGNCPAHGEFFLDALDSPCPSCEDGVGICPTHGEYDVDEPDSPCPSCETN